MRKGLIAKLESNLMEPSTTIDLTKLTDEQREQAFIVFGEGSKELTDFLRTAYAHGAPSMFACSGHGVRQPYVSLRVTDENLQMLQYLGKVLSNYGVTTSFENHHLFGKRVFYHGYNNSDDLCAWLNTATDVLEHPDLYANGASKPTMLYHETMTSSYVPLSYKIKKSLLESLKKRESMKLHSELPKENEEIGLRRRK